MINLNDSVADAAAVVPSLREDRSHSIRHEVFIVADELERVHRALPNPACAHRLMCALARASQVLRPAYTDTEQSNLYDEILLDHPEYANDLAALKTEHTAILSNVYRLHDELYWLDWPDVSPEFIHRLGRLARRIRANEAAEREILLNALYCDVGTGD